MDKHTEYKMAGILSSAMRLYDLVRLGAPPLILENEHKTLTKRVGEFFEQPPVKSLDEMEKSINYSDFVIIRSLLHLYDWDAVLKVKEELDKGDGY